MRFNLIFQVTGIKINNISERIVISDTIIFFFVFHIFIVYKMFNEKLKKKNRTQNKENCNNSVCKYVKFKSQKNLVKS